MLCLMSTSLPFMKRFLAQHKTIWNFVHIHTIARNIYVKCVFLVYICVMSFCFTYIFIPTLCVCFMCHSSGDVLRLYLPIITD